MKNTEDIPVNMLQVLMLLEKKLEGHRLFRYLCEDGIQEVYAEKFFSDIRSRARCIADRGFERCRIGIMQKSSYDWIVNFCAVFYIGGSAVLLDYETDAETLKNNAERTDMEAVICDNELKERAGSAQITHIMTEDTFSEYKNETDFPAYIEKEPDDLACIFFTSGTTAVSKAVMISERALSAGLCHRINDRPFHTLLSVLPFHHISGFSSVLNALYLGKEVCLAVDPKYFFVCMEKMKPDYVFVVPSMLRMIARRLKNGGKNGHLIGWDLHLINCGGAAFRPEFLQMLLDRGITVLQGYGASETGAIGFLWEMTPQRPDTIGKPPEEMKAKIVDGELFLKCQGMMSGYYDDPQATEQVLKDGWYATGDLCRIDEEGFYYLTGRRKNVIILSNGENISPEEIESRLYRCSRIKEVLVYARGEFLAADIFPDYPAQYTDAEQEEVCSQIRNDIKEYNRSVPVYRQIRKIYFSENPLKKTASGKIMRLSAVKGESR